MSFAATNKAFTPRRPTGNKASRKLAYGLKPPSSGKFAVSEGSTVEDSWAPATPSPFEQPRPLASSSEGSDIQTQTDAHVQAEEVLSVISSALASHACQEDHQSSPDAASLDQHLPQIQQLAKQVSHILKQNVKEEVKVQLARRPRPTRLVAVVLLAIISTAMTICIALTIDQSLHISYPLQPT
ncbi:hypothetical protein WJX74_001599 [Apatococcus lobatus]|uniref:Uncharacterized protein n=1 Tax=Apatococcus lobatus TaxID=904363 RepID=A0AAW1RZD8_9CHLO